MAAIPKYDQWMKDTHSLVRPRSEFLKKLDASIKDYEGGKGSKEAIKTALDRWKFDQRGQGKDWTKSVRNEKGAVTSLYRAVNEDKRKLTKEEIEAMRYLSRAQAVALQKQFLGVQMKFKSSTLVGMAQGAGSKWERFKTGAASLKEAKGTYGDIKEGISGIKDGADLLKKGGKVAATNAAKSAMSDQFADIRSKIVSFCKDLCPGLDPNAVMTALHLGSLESFASNLAPFVGAISSGGKALIGWAGVAKSAYTRHDLESRRFAFAPKDPEAAFDAVLAQLKREIISKTAKATTTTVAFTGKLLGAFADAGAVTGPAIGLLETLADIFQTIVEYVRDYKEVQKANELLRLGALSLDLFGVCPILGCYFLCIQDHSTIINFAVADYGTPNFALDVEHLIKKIEPVLQQAREFIFASRFEIPGTENAKGIAGGDWKSKTRLGKLAAAPDHIQDSLISKVEGWFIKPEKPPPTVDPARIVGFGTLTTGGMGQHVMSR